jgi:hypothetical protein
MVWIAKRARPRRAGSVCSSPSHSSHHRARVAAGSSAATARSRRPDAERACRLRFIVAQASVSSSAPIASMRSRAAAGAKMSSDSPAFLSCLACGMNCMVRMLCSRSASLIMTALASADSAAAITRAALRRPWPLAWSSAAVSVTRAATLAPNSRISAASVYGVSSIVSCSSPAHSISSSAPASAKIAATASG